MDDLVESDPSDIIPTPAKRQRLNVDEDFENDNRPMCLYGSNCYRRSPDHQREYKHGPRKLSPAEQNLPPCKNGANCFDRNLLHFALYYHPTGSDNKSKLASLQEESREIRLIQENEVGAVSGSTDAPKLFENLQNCISNKQHYTDLEQNEVMIEKRVKSEDAHDRNIRHDTIFKRGPSILRSYSALTEEQRKDLIRRAFEVKQSLMKKLSETEEVLKEQTEELERLQTKLDKSSLMVDGEADAIKENKFIYCPLFPQRKYQEESAAQIHFRLAESQFYRLLPSGSPYKVTKVVYVVQPTLIHRFKMAREKLKDAHGEEASLPVLGFHGTKEKNIESICEFGFRVPGEPDFQHATDPGWFGKGVYFSEYPKYSMNYIKDASKLLLCQVLPGKVFRCKHIIQGDSLRKGFDSHMSPDRKEVVIFNSHHILPSYIVHYEITHGDFQYEQDE